MSDQYSLGYNLLMIIQLLTFVDALIWSVQQIILPHNPKLFKIKFFVSELVFRFFIIFLYLFSYFLFNNKILLNTIYLSIFFISSTALFVINRKKIKNLF